MQNQLPYEKVRRKIIIKKEFKSNIKTPSIPKRSIEELTNYGVININKNSGPTSHQVSAYVQKILKINKSGHSGTLDPNVTGVLPIALGRATRIVQTLLNSGKEYVALMYLHKDVKKSEIKKAVKYFIGKIKQIPPVKSSVKRQEREREVYYFKILEIDGRYVLFKIGCQAGTYIRKLIHDFGQKLNTGAHMLQLIRTKVGPFNDKNWHSLIELKDAYEENNEEELRKIILPIEKAVDHLPKIWVSDSIVNKLCYGNNLYSSGINKFNNFKENEIIAVMTLKNELICLGISLINYKNITKNKERIVLKTKKVFMKQSTRG